MSYCVKHAENFHTQTCCRCNDESAIAAKDAEIAALRQRCGRLERELRIIAEANPNKWDEDMRDQFQLWAQNRARFALHNDLAPAAKENTDG